MDNRNLENLIDQFCKQLVDYENGDILGAMDLQEILKDIQAASTDFPCILALSQYLIEQSDLLYKGAYLEVAEKLSAGGDLLQHGVRSLDEPGEQFLNDLDLFLAPRTMDDFIQDLGGLIEADSSEKSLQSINVNDRDDQNEKDDLSSEKTLLQETLASAPYQTFSLEMEERHSRIEELVLIWEDLNAPSLDIVNELFRIFHTIKGECGFFNIKKIAEVAHELETMLDLLRTTEIALEPDMSSILLAGNDTVFKLAMLLSSQKIQEYYDENLFSFLTDITNLITKLQTPIGEILVEEGVLKPPQVEHLLDIQQEENFDRKIGEIALDEGIVQKESLNKVLEHQKKVSKKNIVSSKTSELVNVRIDKIQDLSSLVQELWIKESQMDSEEVRGLKKITKDIQNIIMSLQTVKMGRLYTQLRRMIRDLSQKMNKKVMLTCTGEDLEIDRSMVNNLDEPMVHILRNSMDHGIEDAEERKKTGKSVQGHINVTSRRQGNRIIIQIRDDGRGLNRERILEKAIDHGLVARTEAEALSPQQVWKLIMQPGFSTAEAITQYSGRGVGMDVVNSMVQQFRGRISIDSVPGEFTEFTLSFPLNMAIIDGMVVTAGQYIFIIPVSEIVQCIELENTRFQSVAEKTNVITVMKEVIPVIPLCQLFCHTTDLSMYKAAVIVSVNKRKFALLVERIVEKVEVALKPLGRGLENLRGISSGTIFSGGKIGYILDIEEVVQMEVQDE